MIIIDKQTRGRHGNKLFHFNTLMQLSSITGQSVSTAPWDGYDSFERTCEVVTSHHNATEIPFSDLIHSNTEELHRKYSQGNWRLHPLSLCGPFFRITKVDPRNLIRLKETPQLPAQSIGVHVRGGDTRGADGMNCKEIHTPDYYINAIDLVLREFDNPEFYLCTDDPDPNYPSYYTTLKYLEEKNVTLHHNTSNHYLDDFATLTECDVLISGSSTFSLAAGMIGKHKRIIHSKDFVEQFKDEDQKWYSNYGNGMFFHDMNHITSKYYNVWKLI